MLTAPGRPQDARGATRLLAHCAVVDLPSTGRRTAYARLEDALGDDLARLLVGALSAPQRGVSRDLAC